MTRPLPTRGPLAAALAALALAPAAADAAPHRDLHAAAVKAVLAGDTAASGERLLPLGVRIQARPSSARRRADLRALSTANGPRRVLISVAARQDLAGVTQDARAMGDRVRAFRATGVVAVTARSPAAVVERFSGDPRVTALEPDRPRTLFGDSADAIDPETGIPFGWAFGEVRAGQGLAAIGGGSDRVVAVIDSGADVNHPDIRDAIVGTFSTSDGSTDVTDGVGHGTFVTGLIGMKNDNDLGGRGVGGATGVLAIRADNGFGEFSTESLLIAKEVAIRRGAHILNLSLGGDTLSESEARSLDFAFLNDVLPVAAAGNAAQQGNPVQFPAAAIGGVRGSVGIGLSVGATKPDGRPAEFSTHNLAVSLAAPGAGQSGCAKGVFSTVPANSNLIFDDPQSCSDVYVDQGARFGYNEGTSFAAPLVSAVAALAWRAERRLRSEQVADVLQRSARPTFGGDGWNEFTGHGVVDAEAAVAEARRYDVLAPRFRVRTRRAGRRTQVFVGGGRDRANPGERLAGRISYALLVRTDDGGVRFIVRFTRRAFRRALTVRGRTRYVALACDANGNCATRRFTLR